MKNLFILLLLGIVGINNYSQDLPQEFKDKVLTNLLSSDYVTRGSAILDAKRFYIPESIPILKSILWQQDIRQGEHILSILEKYDSLDYINIAHQFFDAVDTLRDEYLGVSRIDRSEIKKDIVFDLFSKGDYSKVDFLFQYIELKKPGSFLGITFLLREVLNNVPEYHQQAKDELFRIAKWDGVALIMISERYGSEANDVAYHAFLEAKDEATRQIALQHLMQYNYIGLENLIKSRVFVDTVWTSDFANTLLDKFGSISNYKFIKDNYDQISNIEEKGRVSFALQWFKPQEPDSSLLIEIQIQNLNEIIDTSFIYYWLGDLAFTNVLKSILQSAKTFLQDGDSLACKAQVKTFQDLVDNVYKDSLNPDPRFVTIEGWKFLYWNAQYILDRLPEPPIETEISTYSLFASHSLWLEQNSEVLSGNIGVNNAGSPPFLDSQVELSIGIGTTTSVISTIKANRVKVKQSSIVNGNVYYNELENNGTITGTLNTPLTLPLIMSIPEFKTASIGTQNINIPQNGEYTLQPGSYNNIDVKKNGRLNFTGGEYHINNITLGDNNNVMFQSSSEIRMAGKFDSGQGSYIGPQDTTSISAEDIVFYVGGINGSNGNLGATPKAAKIGIGNTVKANIYVPNGTLWIRQNSEAEGAFIGKDVDVGIGVKVKLNSAF